MTTTTETKKAVSAVEATIEGEGLTLTFANRQVLVINASQLTPEICTQALMHGLKQKLVDAAAIARNTETGRSATVDDKYAAVKEVHGRLMAGLWNKPREGGSATGPLLARALVEHSGKTREAIDAYLAKLSDAEKTALKKNPKIAAIIARLKPEPKTDGVDSDALLGELLGDDGTDGGEGEGA